MADTSCKGYRDHDAVLEGFSFDVAQVAVLGVTLAQTSAGGAQGVLVVVSIRNGTSP